MPLRQGYGASFEIFTRMAQVLPKLLSGRDADLFVVRLGALLHHHAVGALGHHTAGHDAHAFAGVDRFPEWLPGEARADFPENRFTVRLEVRKAHRPTVHGGIAMGRNIHRRNDIFREHTIQRRPNRHSQGAANRREELTDQEACLVHRHRIRIVVVGATGFAQGFGIFDLGHGFGKI